MSHDMEDIGKHLYDLDRQRQKGGFSRRCTIVNHCGMTRLIRISKKREFWTLQMRECYNW